MSKKMFASFITAGDPTLAKSQEFIETLSEYSDIVEIGLPFSDPIAEGEVIQAANVRALSHGTTTDKIFDMLKNVKVDKVKKHLVILTYINPVFVYGYEKFFKTAQQCGVYGVIIPDLPYEERGEIESHAKRFGVHLITLIAPTSDARIKMLAKNASGFIYLVSSMGVTGVRSEFTVDLAKIIKQIKSVTSIPVMIGFGIATPQQAKEMSKIADGVIIGSAIVKIVAEHGGNSTPHLREYAKSIRTAIDNI